MGDDSFSNVPQSIGEIKAAREHSGAHWTPRDALVSTLRSIDKGELNPNSLIIVFDTLQDSRVSTYYVAAVKGFHKAVGLLTYARWLMMDGNKAS